MLYWLTTDLDFSRVDGEPMLDREAGALREWHRARSLLRCWRRMNGRGFHALVDFAGPEALDDAIGALPTYGALQELAIAPLRAHKRFGEFAHWREQPGVARGQLYHVRLAIDRARLEPARDDELVERAEKNARRHIDEGQVAGIWREPHGNGAFMAWCVGGPDELHHELDTLPLKPWLRGVHVEPMVPLRGLEGLAGWDR